MTSPVVDRLTSNDDLHFSRRQQGDCCANVVVGIARDERATDDLDVWWYSANQPSRPALLVGVSLYDRSQEMAEGWKACRVGVQGHLYKLV